MGSRWIQGYKLLIQIIIIIITKHIVAQHEENKNPRICNFSVSEQKSYFIIPQRDGFLSLIMAIHFVYWNKYCNNFFYIFLWVLIYFIIAPRLIGILWIIQARFLGCNAYLTLKLDSIKNVVEFSTVENAHLFRLENIYARRLLISSE